MKVKQNMEWRGGGGGGGEESYRHIRTLVFGKFFGLTTPIFA